MVALCVEGDKTFIGEVISIFLLLFWKETYSNIHFFAAQYSSSLASLSR